MSKIQGIRPYIDFSDQDLEAEIRERAQLVLTLASATRTSIEAWALSSTPFTWQIRKPIGQLRTAIRLLRFAAREAYIRRLQAQPPTILPHHKSL